MKKLLLLMIAGFGMQIQANAQVVHIELNLLNHQNNANNVTGCILEPTAANYKMYVHSGVCSATTAGVPAAADCQNPNFVWEHVVGDWGQDNTFGQMTRVADSLWAIDIDVNTYYSNPATISQTGQGTAGASSPKPVGATAYSMGFVFRNEDGTIGGITGGCTDFFIFNLDQGNSSVDVGQPGFSLPDTTFSVNNTPSSVNSMVSASFKTIYPNPFNDEVKITYNSSVGFDDIDFSIYNAMGQKVRSLYRGSISSGVSTLVWDAKNEGGATVDAGIYYLTISDGKNVVTEKIVKQTSKF